MGRTALASHRRATIRMMADPLPSVSPPRESRMRMKCLHCGGFARARSSDLLTPTYREVRFECLDDACGFVWVAGLEALRTLCPSDRPNPAIHVPVASLRHTAILDPAAYPTAG